MRQSTPWIALRAAHPTAVDALCLALITIVSAVPYVARLGFYSDDWSFLSGFHFDDIHGRLSIGSILNDPSFRPRPVQGLYLAALYSAFGLNPLGHHLVNTTVIAASMPLLYVLLLRLKVDRATAFAAAAILIVLPQLSTIRVWYSAFQIPLSMLFALGSLHLQLSYYRSGEAKWAFGALAAALISIAAYEIFAPMLVAFAIAIAWLRGRQGTAPGSHRSWLPLLVVVAGVAAALLFKSLLSERVRAPDLQMYFKGLIQLLRPDYDWRVDYGLNIFASPVVNLWQPVLGWAKAAATSATGTGSTPVIAAGLIAASLAFWRLYAAGDRTGSTRPLGAILLGLAAFALGHATFLIVPDIMFAPTGIANRALVAAAIGVALLFASLLVLVVRLLPRDGRALALAGSAAALVFVGVCRIGAITDYWAAAPEIQARVLAAAKKDLLSTRGDATIILDGVCPYHGPAILFESSSDVSGVLSLALGRQVRGDVVSPRASLRADGFDTSIYGERTLYAYGRSLYVYDPRRHLVVALADEAAARRYFMDPRRPRLVCPRGYVGQGSLI